MPENQVSCRRDRLESGPRNRHPPPWRLSIGVFRTYAGVLPASLGNATSTTASLVCRYLLIPAF